MRIGRVLPIAAAMTEAGGFAVESGPEIAAEDAEEKGIRSLKGAGQQRLSFLRL